MLPQDSSRTTWYNAEKARYSFYSYLIRIPLCEFIAQKLRSELTSKTARLTMGSECIERGLNDKVLFCMYSQYKSRSTISCIYLAWMIVNRNVSCSGASSFVGVAGSSIIAGNWSCITRGVKGLITLLDPKLLHLFKAFIITMIIIMRIEGYQESRRNIRTQIQFKRVLPTVKFLRLHLCNIRKAANKIYIGYNMCSLTGLISWCSVTVTVTYETSRRVRKGALGDRASWLGDNTRRRPAAIVLRPNPVPKSWQKLCDKDPSQRAPGRTPPYLTR